MRLSPLVFLFIVAGGGCTAEHAVDVQSLRGPLTEVVKTNHLDRYHSWPIMNLPPGEDGGEIYFLDRGDLTLRYFGNPPILRSAAFWPSDQSAEERFQQANAEWEKWVNAHGGFKDPK